MEPVQVRCQLPTHTRLCRACHQVSLTVQPNVSRTVQEVEDGDSAIVVAIVVGQESILASLLNAHDTLEYLQANRARLMQLALDMGISTVINVLQEGLREVDEFEEVRVRVVCAAGHRARACTQW